MSTKYCDKLPTFLSHNITSIHSLHCPSQALYICTSLPDARPLEDDRRQLLTSVGYDRPEEWVGIVNTDTGNSFV